jgi:hypothetical protein
MVASFVHGDGSLRGLEGLLGPVMFLVGYLKARRYRKEAERLIGIGLVDIIGGMTAQQIAMAKGFIQSLGRSKAEVPQTTETPTDPNAASNPS